MEWGKVKIGSCDTKMTASSSTDNLIMPVSRYTSSLIEGSLVFFLVIIYIFFSVPIFIYRLLITNLVAPLFRPKIGKPVTVISNAYATDLYHNQRAPRTAIVVDFVLEGNYPINDVVELLDKRLINATFDNGQLKYPELKQYVEPWMGFLFWKQDLNFRLNDHITVHELDENYTEAECEGYACQLIEEQLNKVFPAKKSPWEVHLVHNYKLKNNKYPSTMIVFRFQHCIADGYSIIYALIEGLGDTSLDKMLQIKPSHTHTQCSKRTNSLLENCKQLTISLIQCIHNFLQDVDYGVNLRRRTRSPWHVPDENKHWKHLLARSDLIPTARIKETKDRLGVTFTALILSAISAGISDSLKRKGKRNGTQVEIDCLPTFSTIPLPHHPKGLQNHHAGVVFDIPAKIDLNSVDRLIECQNFLAHAKQSLLLPLALFVWKMLGCQLACMNAKVFSNKLIPAFLSNFAGPRNQMEFYGRKLLTASFAVGGGSGIAGIGFMIFSYHDFMRIVLTAENAVMTKEELQKMLSCIVDELNCLHEISLSKDVQLH